MDTKQIFIGNILFITCCVFYLAWWFLAFKPVDPIKGFKTGWLLIPAAALGIAAVVIIIREIAANASMLEMLSGKAIIICGIAAYIILTVVTITVFKRPVTTELILIIGWAMLAAAEVDLLNGAGQFSATTAWALTSIIIISMFVFIICYIKYYDLSAQAGYIVGMIPLLGAALIMIVITFLNTR